MLTSAFGQIEVRQVLRRYRTYGFYPPAADLSSRRNKGTLRMLVKKSVAAFTMVACVVLGMTSAARATIVDANDEWQMRLDVGQTFTCIAQFIPDGPNIPDSLTFPKVPEWYDWYVDITGWEMALSADNKTAYLHGPAITNNSGSLLHVFDYILYYQWDSNDVVDQPVYLDVVVFNGQDILVDNSYRGTPQGPHDPPGDVTWREQFNPTSPPYENPVPEPVTFVILGLGTLFLKRRRR